MALVNYELGDGVAVVTLDDGKVNVLSSQMWAEINQALDRAEADEAVVIITGRPGIFSGGFDLKTLRGGGQGAELMLDAGFRTAERMLSFPNPIVAAVSGHAIAMGSFVVMSCDYRIGIDGPFKLVANEVSIGMPMPKGIIELCRLRLSPSHLSRAMSLSEPFEGRAAVEAGFLDEVVDDDALVSRASERAAAYASLSRSAYRATKARVRESGIAAVRAGFEADSAERSAFVRDVVNG